MFINFSFIIAAFFDMISHNALAQYQIPGIPEELLNIISKPSQHNPVTTTPSIKLPQQKSENFAEYFDKLINDNNSNDSNNNTENQNNVQPKSIRDENAQKITDVVDMYKQHQTVAVFADTKNEIEAILFDNNDESTTKNMAFTTKTGEDRDQSNSKNSETDTENGEKKAESELIESTSKNSPTTLTDTLNNEGSYENPQEFTFSKVFNTKSVTLFADPKLSISPSMSKRYYPNYIFKDSFEDFKINSNNFNIGNVSNNVLSTRNYNEVYEGIMKNNNPTSEKTDHVLDKIGAPQEDFNTNIKSPVNLLEYFRKIPAGPDNFPPQKMNQHLKATKYLENLLLLTQKPIYRKILDTPTTTDHLVTHSDNPDGILEYFDESFNHTNNGDESQIYKNAWNNSYDSSNIKFNSVNETFFISKPVNKLLQRHAATSNNVSNQFKINDLRENFSPKFQDFDMNADTLDSFNNILKKHPNISFKRNYDVHSNFDTMAENLDTIAENLKDSSEKLDLPFENFDAETTTFQSNLEKTKTISDNEMPEYFHFLNENSTEETKHTYYDAYTITTHKNVYPMIEENNVILENPRTIPTKPRIMSEYTKSNENDMMMNDHDNKSNNYQSLEKLDNVAPEDYTLNASAEDTDKLTEPYIRPNKPFQQESKNLPKIESKLYKWLKINERPKSNNEMLAEDATSETIDKTFDRYATESFSLKKVKSSKEVTESLNDYTNDYSEKTKQSELDNTNTEAESSYADKFKPKFLRVETVNKNVKLSVVDDDKALSAADPRGIVISNDIIVQHAPSLKKLNQIKRFLGGLRDRGLKAGDNYDSVAASMLPILDEIRRDFRASPTKQTNHEGYGVADKFFTMAKKHLLSKDDISSILLKVN